jgi:hypothetical protein
MDMYSSVYLNHISEAGDREELDTSHWATAELRIGREYLAEGIRYAQDVTGAELDIRGSTKDMDFAWFAKPKYASPTPFTINMYDMKAECDYALGLTLLGNGFLKLRVPGAMLPHQYELAEDVVVIGVRPKTMRRIEKDMETDENHGRLETLSLHGPSTS